MAFAHITIFIVFLQITHLQTAISVEKGQSINPKVYPYSNTFAQINSTIHNLSNQNEINRRSLITSNQLKRLKCETVGSTDCGHLKILTRWHEKIIPICEGEKISYIEFENIHNMFENGSVILTNNQCNIEICGASRKPLEPVTIGNCKDFWKSESPVPKDPYSNSYHLSSVSCGCQKNRPNCRNENCSTKSMDELIPSNTKMCGVLFQETDCQDCYHDGIFLEKNKKFETYHALSVKSFLLRPGCKMERTTYTLLFLFIPSPQLYNQSESNIKLSYTRRGEDFICRCDSSSKNGKTDPSIPLDFNPPEITTTQGATQQVQVESTTTLATPLNASLYRSDISNPAPPKLNIPEVATTLRTKMRLEVQVNSNITVTATTNVNATTAKPEEPLTISPTIILISSIGALLLVAGTAVLILTIYICRRPRKKLHNKIVLTKEEIRNFKSGMRKKQGSNSIEMGNLPAGYARALDLPYDSKFELNRRDIQYNPGDPDSIIGEGEFGVVYKGMFVTLDKNRFQDVAIKTLRTESQRRAENVKALLNEIKVLSYIGYHTNIVFFVGACTVNLEKGDVLLILKLCHGGSLKKYLILERESMLAIEDNASSGNFNESSDDDEMLNYSKEASRPPKKREISQSLYNKLIQWSEEIATGMEYLTTKNVVHIDLAARNVLLTEDLTAKIGDFGLSRKLYERLEYDKSGKEPIPIRGVALESLTGKKYSKMSDVWSYGVTLWEIFSLGEDPYQNLSPLEIFSNLANGHRLPCPRFASSGIYEEMLRCWNEDPETRPSFTNLKEYFHRMRANYITEVVDS